MRNLLRCCLFLVVICGFAVAEEKPAPAPAAPAAAAVVPTTPAATAPASTAPKPAAAPATSAPAPSKPMATPPPAAPPATPAAAPGAAAKAAAPAEKDIYRKLWDINTPHLTETETSYLEFNETATGSFLHLGQGWKEPVLNRFVTDNRSFWSTSLVSDLQVTVVRPRPLELTLIMFPMLLPDRPQRVDVYWNGSKIGECQFKLVDGWLPQNFSFLIPEAIEKKGENLITFRSLFAVTPTEMKVSSDDRRHAFSLQAIGLCSPHVAPVASPPIGFKEDGSVTQPPDAVLKFPLRVPASGKALFQMDAPTADEEQKWEVHLLADGLDAPVDNTALKETADAKDYKIDLEAYKGQTIELVFDLSKMNKPITWHRPRVTVEPMSEKKEATAAGAAPKAKNVLLITCDALRAAEVGAYGYRPDVTPTIDRLSREGVKFSRAYAAAPYTYSSAWSLLTSLYPFQHKASESPLKAAEDATRLQGALKKAGIKTGCVSAMKWISPTYGIADGFDEFVDAVESPEILRTAGQPQLVTEPAIDFLKRNKDDRFFLFVHYRQPHEPYFPPQSVKNTIVSDTGALLEPSDKLMLDVKQGRKHLNDEEVKQLQGLYDEGVRGADDEIGKLMEALKANGLNENTLVIFASDHGEGFEEHGEISHGFTVYEEVTHIPLVAWGAGIKPNLKIASYPVSNVDIAPTICDALDVARPASMVGENLFMQAMEPGDQVLAFSAGGWQLPTHTWDPREAFWWERYKLVRDTVSYDVEVYDLAHDPGERVNLAPVRPVLKDYLLSEGVFWRGSQEKRAVGQPIMQQIETTDDSIEALRTLGYL